MIRAGGSCVFLLAPFFTRVPLPYNCLCFPASVIWFLWPESCCFLHMSPQPAVLATQAAPHLRLRATAVVVYTHDSLLSPVLCEMGPVCFSPCSRSSGTDPVLGSDLLVELLGVFFLRGGLGMSERYRQRVPLCLALFFSGFSFFSIAGFLTLLSQGPENLGISPVGPSVCTPECFTHTEKPERENKAACLSPTNSEFFTGILHWVTCCCSLPSSVTSDTSV